MYMYCKNTYKKHRLGLREFISLEYLHVSLQDTIRFLKTRVDCLKLTIAVFGGC